MGQLGTIGLEKRPFKEPFTSVFFNYLVIDVITSKGLVTNYGEGDLQNWRGRAHEVLPLRKGGGRKKF